MKITYSIAQELFKLHPNYIRLVIVAEGVRNDTARVESVKILREAERDLKASYNMAQLLDSPFLRSWKEAFKTLGAGSDFRPAHEALARRVLQGKDIPDINNAVNIGNAMSLRYLIPIGMHPLEGIDGQINLTLASGDEVFIPAGTDRQENPQPNEVILAVRNKVLTRCWVWRQASFSLTLPATQMLAINLDILPPIPMESAVKMAECFTNRMKDICGGTYNTHVLSGKCPASDLELGNCTKQRMLDEQLA